MKSLPICPVCKNEFIRRKKVIKETLTCSSKCYELFYHKGYYDIDGSFKISDKVYKKRK